jgi:nicotinamidase-related amidase
VSGQQPSYKLRSGTTEPAKSGTKRTEGGLLAPNNCVVILIDHQPPAPSAAQLLENEYFINNVKVLAQAAKIFNVPVIMASVSPTLGNGPVMGRILEVFPGHPVIQVTSMNCWESDTFVSSIEAIGRRQLVMAGDWTEACLCMPALCALEEGYTVYAVEDASIGTSRNAHSIAMLRMTQAGVVPVTSMQVMLELQRDWARVQTAEAVRRTVGIGAEGT